MLETTRVTILPMMMIMMMMMIVVMTGITVRTMLTAMFALSLVDQAEENAVQLRPLPHPNPNVAGRLDTSADSSESILHGPLRRPLLCSIGSMEKTSGQRRPSRTGRNDAALFLRAIIVRGNQTPRESETHIVLPDNLFASCDGRV
jgi:hypothetical protein